MSNLYFDNVVQVGQLYLEYVFLNLKASQYYLHVTIN